MNIVHQNHARGVFPRKRKGPVQPIAQTSFVKHDFAKPTKIPKLKNSKEHLTQKQWQTKKNSKMFSLMKKYQESGARGSRSLLWVAIYKKRSQILKMFRTTSIFTLHLDNNQANKNMYIAVCLDICLHKCLVWDFCLIQGE